MMYIFFLYFKNDYHVKVLKDSNKRKAYDEQLKYSSQTFNQSSNINYENLRFFIQKLFIIIFF